MLLKPNFKKMSITVVQVESATKNGIPPVTDYKKSKSNKSNKSKWSQVTNCSKGFTNALEKGFEK